MLKKNILEKSVSHGPTRKSNDNCNTKNNRRKKTGNNSIIRKNKPLLDEGYSFNKALTEITGRSVTNYRCGWFKDLIDYAKTQGYDYHEYKWKRGKKQGNNL